MEYINFILGIVGFIGLAFFYNIKMLKPINLIIFIFSISLFFFVPLAYYIAFLILGLVSIIDIETGEIPHILTIMLLLIGIYYFSIHFNAYNLISFVIITSVFIATFLIANKVSENFGGGDLKLYIIISLFYNIPKFMIFYIFDCILGVLTIRIKKKLNKNTNSLRYAPIIYVSFISAYFIIKFISEAY